MTSITPDPRFAGLPTAADLQPLADAAHAVVSGRYPKSETAVSVRLSRYGIFFEVATFDIPEAAQGLMVESASTPEGALAALKRRFDALPAKADRIAELKAELAKLEGTP